ncbi:MAG TPA: carbohydrate-binding family 9-like protein [bacterium]
MKTKTIFLITIVILIQFAFCKKNENRIKSENLITAIYSQTLIIVDGLLNEPDWQEAQQVHLRNSDTDEQVTDTTFSTYALTCYDKNNLYIAFVCNDRDIYSSFTNRDQHLWEEEAIEIFIDVDDEPNTYVEIELSPNNVLFDSYIVDPINIDIEETSKFDLPGIKTAVSANGTVNFRVDEDKSWTAEIAISFSDIIKNFKSDILKETKWKINYYRIDRDNDGPTHYAWSPTMGRFHKPSVFGKLVFK